MKPERKEQQRQFTYIMYQFPLIGQAMLELVSAVWEYDKNPSHLNQDRMMECLGNWEWAIGRRGS